MTRVAGDGGGHVGHRRGSPPPPGAVRTVVPAYPQDTYLGTCHGDSSHTSPCTSILGPLDLDIALLVRLSLFKPGCFLRHAQKTSRPILRSLFKKKET